LNRQAPNAREIGLRESTRFEMAARPVGRDLFLPGGASDMVVALWLKL